MKSFAIIFVISQALLQLASSQYISGPCGCGPNLISAPLLAPSVVAPTVAVAQPSVASSLADTLSLLTVSSLLSDTLPLGYPNVLAVSSPVAVPAPYYPAPLAYSAPIVAPYGNCGCGCGGIYY